MLQARELGRKHSTLHPDQIGVNILRPTRKGIAYGAKSGHLGVGSCLTLVSPKQSVLSSMVSRICGSNSGLRSDFRPPFSPLRTPASLTGAKCRRTSCPSSYSSKMAPKTGSKGKFRPGFWSISNDWRHILWSHEEGRGGKSARQCKSKVSDEENDEGQQEKSFPAPFVGKVSGRI